MKIFPQINRSFLFFCCGYLFLVGQVSADQDIIFQIGRPDAVSWELRGHADWLNNRDRDGMASCRLTMTSNRRLTLMKRTGVIGN